MYSIRIRSIIQKVDLKIFKIFHNLNLQEFEIVDTSKRVSRDVITKY